MKISGFKFKRPRLRFLRRVDDRVKLDSGGRSGDLIKILISIALWIVIIILAIMVFDKGLPKMPKLPQMPINLIYKTNPTPSVLPTAQPSPSEEPFEQKPRPTTALSSPSSSPKTSSQGPSKVIRSCIVCANASPSPSPDKP